MKKILAIFLSVLICFCSAFVAVNAEEEAKINLYFESQRITAEKSTVSLKIDLPENTVINGGLSLGVAYNKDNFSVSNIVSTDWQITSNIYTEPDPEDNEKTIELGYFKVAYMVSDFIGITEDTTLFSFDVTYEDSLPSGRYEFKMFEIQIFDEDLIDLDYKANNDVYINAAAVEANLAVDPSEKELAINETVQLNTIITPNNYYYEEITWSSDLESIATVTSSGLVRAVGYGTATITAVTDTGIVGKSVITVTDLVPESIEISKYPTKLQYKINEYFDDSGMELEVTYSDGSVRFVKDGWTHDKTQPLVSLDHSVVISYRGCTTELEISVNSTSNSGDFSQIEIGNLPKTTYILEIDNFVNFNTEYAENLAKSTVFDFSNLTISATRVGGTLIEDYASYESGLIGVSFKRPHIGNNEITVTFDGLSTSFNIFIDAVMMTVTDNPNRRFTLGTTPKFTGFLAQLDSIYYSFCNTESTEIYEPTVLTSDDFDFVYNNLVLGQNPVIAKYDFYGTSFEYKFNIEMIELQKVDIEITSMPNKLIFPLGEQVDFTGLTVSAVYNDQTKTVLKETDYSIDYEALTVGENKITVSHGGFEKEFNITLLPVPYVSVSAEGDSGKPCEFYEIPISLESGNNSDIKFTKIEITVQYDSSKLEFLEDSIYFANSEMANTQVLSGTDFVKLTWSGSGVTIGDGTNLLSCLFEAKLLAENETLPIKVILDKVCFDDTAFSGEQFADYPLNKTEENVSISLLAHDRKTVTEKAKLSKDGIIKTVCETCGKELDSQTIYRPTSIKLSSSSVTYNGKVRTPSVTVKNAQGKTMTKGVSYDVTYPSGRKNVGKYKITVKFKDKYTGTKTLYFTIVPDKRGISSVTAGTKKMTVKWKTQKTQTSGYQIQYSTTKFKTYKVVTVSDNKNTSKTISKLKSKKTYYVRMRTYKTVGKEKIVSGWSSYKKVKIK